MSYAQAETIRSLITFIKQFHLKERRPEGSPSNYANKPIASFLSLLLANCKITEGGDSYDDLVIFKKHFEEKYQVKVDIDELIRKHWIRAVLGEVKIPSVIRSAAYRWKEQAKYEPEIRFLITIINKYGKQGIDANIFNQALKDYNATLSKKINSKVFEKQHYLNKSNGKITLQNVDYYGPLIDNSTTLSFISAWINRKNDKRHVITNKTLKSLYSNYLKIYPGSFKLEELFDLKILNKGKQGLISVDIKSIGNLEGRGLNKQIATELWNHLHIDKSKCNSEKFLFWKSVTFNFEWFSLKGILNPDSKSSFLEGALECLYKDTDTIGTENEIQKLRLDSLHGDFIQLSATYITKNLTKENLFELFQEIENVGELAIIQQNRYELAFIIYLIVTLDNETVNQSGNVQHYPNVVKLLKQGLERPYFLWKTCHFIFQNKPEIIPYLFAEPALESIGFTIAEKISFPKIPGNDNDYLLHVYKEALKISLPAVSYREPKEQAEFVFHIFRILNKRKYTIRHNPLNDTEIPKEDEIRNKREAEILEQISNAPRYFHKVYPPTTEYFLPGILDDLVSFFLNYQEEHNYNSNIIQLPLFQLDGLVWISKNCMDVRYREEPTINQDLLKKLSKAVLTLYLNKLEQKTGSAWNSDIKQLEERRPLWVEKIERIERIDWDYLASLLLKNNDLDAFLSPNFIFQPAESIYDENNRFNAEKLRSHFRILLQIIRMFATGKPRYLLDLEKRKEIQKKIEQKLSDYVQLHSTSNPALGQVDIFDFRSERMISGVTQNGLLPQLGQAINWFDNKEAILKSIANSSDIIRILLVSEWITSEGLKSLLIKQIKKEKIKAFLNTPYWNTEIQLVLGKIIMYPDLIKYTKDILSYWESMPELLKNHNNLANTVYQTRLFLAFNDKNENALDLIDEKGITPYYNREYYEASDSKEFYRGLIRFTTDPKSSHAIFNTLLLKYPKNAAYALNRLAAGIKWGLKDKDNQIYRDSLGEWTRFEAAGLQPQDSLEIQENVWLNKLIIYNNLKEFEEFDRLYLLLDTPQRMIPNILTERIENLLSRDMRSQAKELLQEARVYHQFEQGSDPSFIKDLIKLVLGDDHLKTLRTNYLEIFGSDVSTLIKVFPPNLNGNEKINPFLTKEIAFAANILLDKIKVIEDIKIEDKYTDLLVLGLEARFIPWGWHLQPQSRGASSASGKGMGERDFVIRAKNIDLTVVEAFNYKSKATVQSHLTKLFNYHHQQDFFIIVIYYLGKKAEFDSKWTQYSEEILPTIAYPKGFEFKGKKAREISKTLLNRSNAIKIGESKHGSKTKIHHIFINTSYLKK